VRNNALQSVYVKSADGAGVAERWFSPEALGVEAAGAFPEAWSPDGSKMVLNFFDKNANNLLVFSVAEREHSVLLESPASETSASISPDGRWLAYTSDQTDRWEIYVRPFEGSGGRWQISTGGGFQPRWAPDSNEIYYRWEHSLYSVKLDATGGSLRWGRPEVVFDDLDTPVITLPDYDVLDRNRFLMLQLVEEKDAPSGATVVVNWLEDVSRRVPR
jgi:dipeptidyl aminopeptidase/acylaminoacyl peptidase